MDKDTEVFSLEYKIKQLEERLAIMTNLNNRGIIVYKLTEENICSIKESIDDWLHIIKKVDVYLKPKDILDVPDVVSIGLSEDKFIFRVEGAEKCIFCRLRMFEIEIRFDVKRKTFTIYDEYLAHNM